jgi:hypothetical protein
MGEGETSTLVSPSPSFVPNKMSQDEAIKLASGLTYGMTEEDVLGFLKRKGLKMDLGKIGDSFGWSDGFSLSDGSLCLGIAPKQIRADGEWVNGLLRFASIYNQHGKRTLITITYAHPIYSSIGLCDGSDTKTKQIIEESLKSAGIECDFEGCGVFEILVSLSKQNRADQVLTKESRLNGAWVRLVNPDTGRLEKRAGSI